MTKSPAPFTVHKNTVERRVKRERRDTAVADVRGLMSAHDVRAYAFVGITAEGKAVACWDTGSILPMWGYPEMIAAALRRDMEESGIAETWTPPLPLKG